MSDAPEQSGKNAQMSSGPIPEDVLDEGRLRVNNADTLPCREQEILLREFWQRNGDSFLKAAERESALVVRVARLEADNERLFADLRNARDSLRLKERGW